MRSEAEERARFERWITGPPYERDVHRWPADPARYGAPGAYRDLAVDLAWYAWLEALERAEEP